MKNKIDIKKWKEFKISDLFDAKNTGNILARDIINGSGNTPYVTARQQVQLTAAVVEQQQ